MSATVETPHGKVSGSELPYPSVLTCITPLNMSDMEKRSVTIEAAVWASGMAAIHRWAKLRSNTVSERPGRASWPRLRRSVEHEDHTKYQHQALPLGRLDANYWVVESGVYQDSGNDLIRPLNDDLWVRPLANASYEECATQPYIGENEGLPGIGFAGSFADLVE